MQLRKNVDLVAFLAAVQQCQGEVIFSTPEGDVLNLKSTLSKYIFALAAAKPDIQETGNVCCQNPADVATLQDYVAEGF